MRVLLFVLGFLLSVHVKAAGSYQLKLDVTVDGKAMQSSVLTVGTGDINTISQQEGKVKRFVDVTLTEVKGKAQQVSLNFVVGNIGANGKREIIATPQMTVELGKTAQMSSGTNKGGAAQVALTATATKVK